MANTSLMAPTRIRVVSRLVTCGASIFILRSIRSLTHLPFCIAAEKRNNPQPPRRSSASTRSSQRLKETKGKDINDVITIDSSDEGDDTSLSASPNARRVRIQFEFINESVNCIHSNPTMLVCVLSNQQCNICCARRVNERLAMLHA